jgi:class 3 adenylate cyclase/TolB-like protein
MPSDARLPRKLAAILYADVAGYSRLTAEDEDNTHRRLRAALDLFAATIKRCGGRVMHYAGDAVLARFDAVVDAVSCAIDVQQELAVRNAGLRQEQRIEFRIGINLGDVIDDRGDVYGDGVNVAARLESLAGAGEICVAESVRAALGNRLPLEFEDLGEQSLKNIDRPVRAYRLRFVEGAQRESHASQGRAAHRAGPKRGLVAACVAIAALAIGVVAYISGGSDGVRPEGPSSADAAVSASGSAEPAAASGRLPNSVAVLPFDSLSADPNDAYITAGIHEEILNQLVRLGSLNAISRTTMMRYAETTKSIPEIARELNVESVIEGSVRRDGDRVLVTVQLIDPQTDLHLWSESYPRELTDVFAIQADIATNVARALEVELSASEQDRLAREAPTDSQEAYELYLAALGMLGGGQNSLAILERLDRAIELDPEFIDAWVLKVNAHAILAGQVADAEAQNAAAFAAASRAIELDSRSGRGHAAIARVLYTQGEWSRAREEFDRARALGAPVPELTPYSVMQLAVGDFAGARGTLLADLVVNPMNEVAAGFLLAVYEMNGERAARRAGYERGETLFGTWFGDNIELFLRLGEGDTEFLRGPIGRPGPGEPSNRIGQRNLGANDAGLDALRTLYAETSNPSAVELLWLTAWTAYFGDPVFSLHLAREAIARQQIAIFYLWLPLFEDVRRLPDFKTVVRDLGLVAYWREYGWPPFCRPLDGDDFACE